MKKLCVALLCLAVASVTFAGELGVSWDAVTYPHPITYEVLRDGLAVGQTASTSLLIPAADDCVSSTYTVTATGAAPGGPLTSEPSAPVISMARPTIASILFNSGGVHRIVGDNYPATVEVEVDGVPVVSGVNRIDCQTVEIPTTAGTPTIVTIINPQPDGQLSVTWTLPPPVPPTSLEVN